MSQTARRADRAFPPSDALVTDDFVERYVVSEMLAHTAEGERSHGATGDAAVAIARAGGIAAVWDAADRRRT